MNNFDPKTARFSIIICGVLLIFALVINHAYKYLPQNDTIPEIQSVEDINSQRDYVEEKEEEVVDNQPVETIDYATKRDKKHTFEHEPITNNQEISEHERRELLEQEKAEQEIIPTPQANETSSFQETLNNAKKSFVEKDYERAIETYKSAMALTDNKIELALCYDDLAKIYAMQKKYGSAIAFAQKAYNAQQTADREILLARLNYRVGNTERANELLKRSLQRDFNF